MAFVGFTLSPNGASGDDLVIEVYGECPLPDQSYVFSEGWSYAGHTLIGYNSAADGSGTSYNIGDNVEGVSGGADVYYAIWEEIIPPVKVSYNDSVIYSTDESETVNLKTSGKMMTDDVTVEVDLDDWANVSGTNATSGDILSGKSARSENGILVGTIPILYHSSPTISLNSSTGLVTAQHSQSIAGYVSSGGTTSKTLQLTTKSAETITPTTADQTIAAGKYLTGTQTIKGDANLIPANIAKDVSIFGVTGTHEGGSSSEPMKDVNFIDYDGTIVKSYTAEEFTSLTALPSNPSHNGLTAQGWNWTLADAKTYVSTYGKLNIGQMYTTSDGKTRIYIHLEEGRLSPMLGVCPNGTVTVDWGDGSATTTLTGASVTTVKWTSNHTYAAAGDYVITLTVSGSMGFLGKSSGADTGGYILRFSSSSDNRNYGYHNAVRRIEIGNNVTSIGNYAFYYCQCLASITIPSSITSIGNYAFSSCYSLTSITIPINVTSIGTFAIASCYSLASITIPSGITSIGNNAFSSCYSLTSITIPSNVTSIGGSAFSGCYHITSITIPSGVTSIENSVLSYCYPLISVTIPNGVTSIGNNAFNSCCSLTSITIPSSVTSIGATAFSKCYSIGFIRFTSSTPPAVANSNALSDIPADCKIYVPSGSLSDYTSATNYPSPSTYTYIEY